MNIPFPGTTISCRRIHQDRRLNGHRRDCLRNRVKFLIKHYHLQGLGLPGLGIFRRGSEADRVADHGGGREAEPIGLLPSPQMVRSTGSVEKDDTIFWSILGCL